MGLAEDFAAEKAAVIAGDTACGYTCVCHGEHICERRVHPRDETPHIATMADDMPVQWMCQP